MVNDLSPELVGARIFLGKVPAMVEEARFMAHDDAHSYRDFRVGAAVFAYNPDFDDMGTFAAGNLKREPRFKVCAERKSIEAAKKSYTEIGGIVVVGTTDTDQIKDVTGMATATLHPCLDCQHLFRDHPLMRKDTPIVTVGLDLDRYQVHTSGQLYEMYTNEQVADLEAEGFSFGFKNWARRLSMFDNLVAAEQVLAESEQRAAGKLVQMAMTARL